MGTFADLLPGLKWPVLQAPMAGAHDEALAIAVARAGGLGALPCAMAPAETVRAQAAAFRESAPGAPLNLNFFCHESPAPDAGAVAAWRARLQPYYDAFGATGGDGPGAGRAPFDAALCALVEAIRPEIVSFHFGLPDDGLLARVKAAGALVISSATTPDEARFLAAKGCDAIIAQGAEAGGHRGMFLTREPAAQIGTMALVPLVADATGLPVIAAGGIADARGVAAARALGASAVQVGTGYLFTPEARISALHRAALEAGGLSAITNVFTGRPARGLINRIVRELGPIAPDAPPFPLAPATLAPLRAAAEKAGSSDFTPLWAGQGAGLCRARSAAELTALLGRAAAGG